MTKKNYIYLLIIIGIIVFFNSLFNGFVWDDEEQVLKNVLISSLSNLPAFFSGSTFNSGGAGTLGGLYYKPLMTALFSFIYIFFGPNPFFFHLFQMSLHICNAIFVFLIFRYFFNFQKRDLLSFILALLFLIHPINSEAVVYISDLQDTLFFFFGIIAFWSLLHYELNSSKSYVLLSLLLLLSILSKESGFLFISITAVYIILFLRKKLWSYLIAISITVGFYSVFRFQVAGIFFNTHGLSPITKMSFSERLVSVPKLSLYYLKTFIYPIDLAINQHWVVKTFNLMDFFIPLFISSLSIGFFIIYSFILFVKKNHYATTFIFFLLWFLGGLVFHLNIIFPLDLTVSDRWFYFPMVGLLGMLGVIAQQIKINNKFLRNTIIFISVIVFISLGIRTIIRNSNWKDGLTLYSHDINISRDAFDLENNLGVELYRIGKIDEAKIHFENSTKLAPLWWTNWNNLGVILEQKNDLEKAKIYYQKAIDNGQYYMAYENQAKLYLQTGTPENTKLFAEQSLKILPNNSTLWFVLAISEYKLGKKDDALNAAKNAYYLDPNQQNLYLYTRISQNLPLE